MSKLRTCDTCSFWVPLADSKQGECHFEPRFLSTHKTIEWGKTTGNAPGCSLHVEVSDGSSNDAGEGTAHHLSGDGVPNADQ